MKPPVAVTLIVMGAILIMAPIASDHLQRSQVAAALATPGVQSVSLEPSLSGYYRFGCWLVGALMVASAVVSSRARSSSTPVG